MVLTPERLDVLVWVLVYAKLLTASLGIFVQRAHQPIGWTLIVCELESLSLMPAHHAQRRPLVVAKARHSPCYGSLLRLDRTPLGALLGHARKTFKLCGGGSIVAGICLFWVRSRIRHQE